MYMDSTYGLEKALFIINSLLQQYFKRCTYIKSDNAFQPSLKQYPQIHEPPLAGVVSLCPSICGRPFCLQTKIQIGMNIDPCTPAGQVRLLFLENGKMLLLKNILLNHCMKVLYWSFTSSSTKQSTELDSLMFSYDRIKQHAIPCWKTPGGQTGTPDQMFTLIQTC